MYKTDRNGNKIHETAVIHPESVIGKGNVIDAYSVIQKGVIVGDNNRIGCFVVIGGNGEIRGGTLFIGQVIIGNNNLINHHVTIDKPMTGITEVGDNNYLMTKAHLGHDVIIKNKTTISSGAMIGGHVVINNHANIGLNAEIHQRITINEGAMIGMGASITKDVDQFKKVVGVNRVIGWNTKKLDELGLKVKE